jgi:hypothetical protein
MRRFTTKEIPQLMEQDSPQKTQKDKKHKNTKSFLYLCVFCPFVFFVVNLLTSSLIRAYFQAIVANPPAAAK